MASVLNLAPPSSAIPTSVIGGRDYYSVSQAAEFLGVSRVSIWRWIRDGRLPASRVGPRTTRIRRLDLERLMVEGGTVSPWSQAVCGPGAGTVILDGAAAVPQADWRAIGPSEHFVQFYDADGPLLDAVAGFIGAALRSGDVGIIIATAAHREGIEQRLWTDGLQVDVARDCGQYKALDAADMLSTFMVDGAPEPERFVETVENVIAQVTNSGGRVRVFGEMVALLALEGNHTAAVRLESLWNALQTRHSFALFCAYPMTCLGGAVLTETLGDVCAQHVRVIPAESYTALPTPDDRFRAIIQWQQKAQSLEAALAAELAARQAAEDALRLREEFLSIASHELKTPLTTLSGHAQMILRQLERDGHLESERVVRSLEVIRGQAGKLSRLITQLLDVSRLEAGKLTLEWIPTDLTRFVEEVVSVAQILSERHTITVAAPPSLEACVDPLRLDQVLTNLVDNAIKYSPEGGQIEVVLIREESDTVELAVRDHGPGVPADKREQLFERFYQAHSDGHQSGMGLGLYISRQIVELHGGTIRAEFPPDGGTRIVVCLPIQ